MSNNGPVNMEGDLNTPSNIQGREVDPDKDETVAPNTEIKPEDDHMRDILKYTKDDMKERVSKLTREEISMPGAPRDREAYEAYIGAEKMIRDLRRRDEKKAMNWKGLSKQNG